MLVLIVSAVAVVKAVLIRGAVIRLVVILILILIVRVVVVVVGIMPVAAVWVQGVVLVVGGIERLRGEMGHSRDHLREVWLVKEVRFNVQVRGVVHVLMRIIHKSLVLVPVLFVVRRRRAGAVLVVITAEPLLRLRREKDPTTTGVRHANTSVAAHQPPAERDARGRDAAEVDDDGKCGHDLPQEDQSERATLQQLGM